MIRSYDPSVSPENPIASRVFQVRKQSRFEIGVISFTRNLCHIWLVYRKCVYNVQTMFQCFC